MKQTFTLLAFLFIVIVSRAQYVTLPDNEFTTFLMQKYPACFNAQGQLDTTCSAIRSEDLLEFHKLGLLNGISLEGIQYFTSLKYLNCYDNLILATPPLPASLLYLDYSLTATQGAGGSVFPAMPKTLRHLNIDSNYFMSVTFPDSLRFLSCSANFLHSLPALPTKLDTLICINENDPASIGHILTALPSLPNTLVYMDCSNNALASLPALPVSLTYLNCGSQYYQGEDKDDTKSLASLPALPSSLIYLNCHDNKLTALPGLPASLIYLNCGSNSSITSTTPPTLLTPGIGSLPALPASLQRLLCGGNNLFSLPALPGTLKQLECSYTKISILPELPSSLVDLSITGDSISELPSNLPPALSFLNCAVTNITCMPHLPASMAGYSPYQVPDIFNPGYNLIYDPAKVLCLPNMYNTLRPGYYEYNDGFIRALTPVLCTPVSNANHCAVYPVVSGITYYDNNSNGVKEAGEEARPNVRVQLSNGMIGFSNNNGYFELSADTGSYTLSVDAPKYYNAVPPAVAHTFTSYDTVTNDLISLQPNASVDSVSISLVPYYAARPGFDYNYTINYENTGTTTVLPVIQVDYDPLRLAYQNSSNSSVVNNGSSLHIAFPAFTPGQKGTFTSNFTVNSSAALGDTLFAKATVNAGNSTAADSVFTVINASHDPNEKLATPSLSALQVASGAYINYQVNFQNTGTDTAFNIVVTDTLSSMLQANTFQVIGSSAPCTITQNGNVIIFEFLNILLPDSSINNSRSLGYIKFRIKSNIAFNSNVSNTADIYFDYNSPVSTNAARTTLAFNVLPVQLVLFKAVNEQNGVVLLHWTTANEAATKNFTIEQSSDGKAFEPMAIINAKGAGSNSYMQKVVVTQEVTYYRLAIKDYDGHVTYSAILKITNFLGDKGVMVLNNPAKGKLSLSIVNESLQGSVAVITNSSGSIVKKFLLQNGNQNIDISNLAAGNYYLKTGSATKKFIVIN